MKVLKFGGAIVGSAEHLKKVKSIVEAEKNPIVVVSAMDGVTDLLEEIVEEASTGDSKSIISRYEDLKTRHTELARQVVPADSQSAALSELNRLYAEMDSMLQALTIFRDWTDNILATFLSYGERLVSVIVGEMIGARVLDSTRFIIAEGDADCGYSIDEETTTEKIKAAFSKIKGAVVCQGFIAGTNDDEIATLGRGSSDLTAAYIAKMLGAQEMQVWKPNDEFMSADPKKITSAYLIEHMSYEEARELSINGVGTLFSDALTPLAEAKIPLSMKNICNGNTTMISAVSNPEDKVIKGIASQDDCVMYTFSGIPSDYLPRMVSESAMVLESDHVPYTVFSLSAAGGSFSVCIPVEYEGYFNNLSQSLTSMNACKVQTMRDLASVVIVGENMKNATGTAGKLFNALGRNNINIVAMNQGSSETSITVVLEKKNIKKALNAIHESFFLTEYQELNIFVVGTGTVGGSLLEQLHSQKELIMNQNGVKLNVMGVADVSKFILDRNGVDLTKYNELLKTEGKESTPESLKKALFELNAFNCVFVDCTAAPAIAAMYLDLLQHNISVVCANKIAASGDYDNYINLKNTARKRGIKYLFETNVGAGLPIINTIGDLIYSGDRIVKLEAVLSGTLNFIFNTISEEIPLSKAIKMAMEARFAEPDPRIDLSGKDVIRKLVILARESGLKVSQEDVEKNLFIPDDFFEGTLDDFWAKVEKFDAEFEEKRKVIAAEGKRWRFVATLDEGKTKVGLQAVDSRHPFYDLEGSNNLIIINTARYKDPMMIRGYGAGAAVTAAGVFADIISIANIR